MEGNLIVEQKQFSSLDDFMKGKNNFHAHFLKGNPWGESKRSMPHFIRFQSENPELEERTTAATLAAHGDRRKLPYELLYESYKIMSKLVFADDEGLKRYSTPDKYLIS